MKSNQAEFLRFEYLSEFVIVAHTYHVSLCYLSLFDDKAAVSKTML